MLTCHAGRLQARSVGTLSSRATNLCLAHAVGTDVGHPDLAAPNVITGTGSCDRSTVRRQKGLPPCYPWASDPGEARSWAKAGRAWLGCTGCIRWAYACQAALP
jgi:hypothetical protein